MAAAFELPKDNVFPRIFSPNGDGINDVVNFDLVDSLLDTSVEGKVFDREGNPVADMRFDSFPSAGIQRWVWDGRDRNGNTVAAGVYIYELATGSDRTTGTVVVIK